MPKQPTKAGKEADATEPKGKVTLVALRNARLNDGTFVGEGERVTVSRDYAELCAKETPPRFKRA
jgi:hypothetical protein